MEVKKAVILFAGIGTRFLPLSNVLSKELWPLVDKPLIHYIVEEARNSGIKQIVFVANPDKKNILDYFKKSLKVEKLLKERKKDSILMELRNVQDMLKNIATSIVFQEEPRGDGDAILQAKEKIGVNPFAVMFNDDIAEADPPCLAQLIEVFEGCQKPVIALVRLPKDQVSAYGVVKVEKIANRVYKIKGIVEKPKAEDAPSDLVIQGKYILTPEVFEYLKKQQPNAKGEIILADALEEMLKDGKVIYGYEYKGRWLECGDKLKWLKSHLYLSLNDPRFGPELKQFLKEIL